jgi:hypothetical protein
VEALAQVNGGVVDGLASGLGPEVESVAAFAALEAAEHILVEVGGEGAAGAGGRAVQWAGAALLSAAGAAGVEAEQLQDGGNGHDVADGGEVDRGASGWRCLGWRLLLLDLAELLATFACLGQFAVASGEDFLVPAIEFVLGCEVVYRGVQADVVVINGVIVDDALSFFERKGHGDPDAFALEGLVPALDFAIGLGIVRRGSDVGHAGDADELFEILGDELGSVVGDDARLFVGEGFAGALDDGLHGAVAHIFADFLVNDEAAVAIEDGANEVKSAGDVEIADVDMPVFMRLERLHKAGAFLGDVGRRPSQEAVGFQDAIDAGRAAGDDIGIEHHEGQAAIAVERVLAREDANPFFFVASEPMIARHPGIMFVDFAEAFFPVMELAGADAEPGQEATDGDFRLVAPVPDEVDDGVTDVVERPAASQFSPSSFFKTVCSSISSARTSFLRISLASSCAILRSLESSTTLDLRSLLKAKWPFSKNLLSQS